jgi:hypothetical protein
MVASYADSGQFGQKRREPVMRVGSFFKPIFCALAICTAGSEGWAQFAPPQNSLRFEDKGTLEAVQGEVMRIRDSKSEVWMLTIVPETKIIVEGEAEAGCLRPGVFVKFTGEIDKKGILKKPLQEIEIVSALGKTSMGLFPEDDTADLKAARAVTAGAFLIKGKLASFRDGDLVTMAGRHKITGTVDEGELKVHLNVDDVSLAQPGDAVQVKVWHYDQGRPNLNQGKFGNAIAEEITVTLKNPLAAGGKKIRQGERPTRATSRSKVSK